MLNLIYDAISSQLAGLRIKVTALQQQPGSGTSGTADHGVGMTLETRLQQQQDARDFIAVLDRETSVDKLARGLDIQSIRHILETNFPDARGRTETYIAVNGKIQDVLVEWKECNATVLSRDETVTRISNITAILKSTWIGIVYDTSSVGADKKPRTLRALLKERRKSLPPLGDRFRLAQRLAETVLQVHNCGWLHKGLRPENVVFFSPVTEPYLLGWDFSRPAKPGQKTEAVMAGAEDAELYLHPKWFDGPSAWPDGSTSRFRAEFDHYQLGCLLLEIGIWCLLDDLRKETTRRFEDDRKSRWAWKEYLESKTQQLETQMGTIYVTAVWNLLHGLETDGKTLDF